MAELLPRSLALLALLVAGCGDEQRRVELVRIAPAADPACGLAGDGITMFVNAVGDFPTTTQNFTVGAEVVDLAGFPPATRQLEVVLLGAGGAVRTIGKTAPLELSELADGAEVPVLMAPPRGFCPVGPPARARARPVLVRTGDGVLLAGGVGDGAIEWYDPATASFEAVAAPERLTDPPGLGGTALTAVPSGGPDRPERAVFTGGARAAYFVFDPVERTFGEPPGALFEIRAYHAAIALDSEWILMAGGCGQLDGDGACTADSLRDDSRRLNIYTGQDAAGPTLSLPRAGGAAVLEPDGHVLLIGGVDADGAPVTAAERIDPMQEGGPGGEVIDGLAGAVVAQPSGGYLAAFAPPGPTSLPDVAALPPSSSTPGAALVIAPDARAGAALAGLEDGSVLVVGGIGDPESGAAEAALISPYLAEVIELPGAPGAADLRRVGAAAVRLPDGSALIVGGADASDADPATDAWIYRPPLTGPFTGALTLTPGVDDEELPLVPLDPTSARREAGGYVITALRDTDATLPHDWAVVAGPELTTLSLELTVTATDGGLAILLGFTGPGDFLSIALARSAAPSLTRLRGGAIAAGDTCPPTAPLPADALAATTAISAELTGTTLTVRLNGAQILSCDLTDTPRGLVGVAPLGATGAAIRLSTLAVAR